MSDKVLIAHRTAEDAARIIVEIYNSQPIELLDLTASLSALAREHESYLRHARVGVSIEETRLLVMDVRKGSIVLELLPALVPIVSTMEVTNTAASFVAHVRDFIMPLRLPGGRAPEATTQQLKNFSDAVQAVANDPKGRTRIAARHIDGKVIQEFLIEKEEAKVVQINAQAQRREMEGKGNAQYRKVLMRLHQSSLADMSVGKRTSEKGIVEKIDMVPRTLIYASDLAGKRIKEEIQRGEGNPFSKGFIVDLDVETVGGVPRLYRITDVIDVVDLEE